MKRSTVACATSPARVFATVSAVALAILLLDLGPARPAVAAESSPATQPAASVPKANTKTKTPPPLWTYQDFLDGKLPPKYEIRKGHPRLLITPDNRAEIVEKAKAGPGLWQQAIDKAENRAAARDDWQQMMAAACLYQVGLVPGFKYAMTREQYGRKGVELLLQHDYKRPGVMGGSPKYYANPCAYDWLYDLLSPEQRKDVVAHLIEAAHHYDSDPDLGPGKLPAVNGVDNQAFILGLAFAGDGIDDPAAKLILDTAWNKVIWNPAYSTKCCSDRARTILYLIRMLEGGGNDEGSNYFTSHDNIPVHVAAWKTAIGVDCFAGMGYFRNLPYWESFMVQPTDSGSLGWGIALHAYIWGGWCGSPPVGACVAAASGYLRDVDPQGAALARWWVDKTFGGAEKVPYLPMFVYGLLIGDPRVAPTPPREMKMPLTWTMPGFNYVFMRSGYWDNPNATLVAFANARFNYRAGARNVFALSKGGAPLFLERADTVFHGYIPNGAVSNNRMVFYKGDQLSGPELLLPPDEYHPDDNARVESVDSAPGEYDYMVGRAGNVLVSSYRFNKDEKTASRTLVYLRPRDPGGHDFIVLLDRCENATAELVPHVVFNTIFQPQVAADWDSPAAKGAEVHPGQTAFDGLKSPCVTVTMNHQYKRGKAVAIAAHGRAFLRTLYPADCRVLTIGGPEHFIDDITGKGSLVKAEASSFLKAPPDDQIERGGHWRFDVVPPAAQKSATHAILNVIEPADSKQERPSGPMQLLDGENVLAVQAGPNIVLLSKDARELSGGSAKAVAEAKNVRLIVGDLKPQTAYTLTCGGQTLKLVSTPAGTVFVKDVTVAAGDSIRIDR